MMKNNNNKEETPTKTKKVKSQDWFDLVESVLRKIGTTAQTTLKMETTATPLLLHFLVLSSSSSSSPKQQQQAEVENILKTIEINSTPAMFPALVRSVVSAVNKIKKQEQEENNNEQQLSLLLSSCISSSSTSSSTTKLALLLGIIMTAEENILVAASSSFPKLIQQQNDSTILHHSLELVTNIMRKRISSSSSSFSVTTETILENFLNAISISLLKQKSGKEEKEFVEEFITSPNSTARIFLNICNLLENDNIPIDENLIDMFSSSSSNISTSQHRNRLSDDDQELVRSALSRIISNRVLLMTNTNTKKKASGSSSQWEQSAKLVSQLWNLEGVPPQELMMKMLLPGSSSSSSNSSVGEVDDVLVLPSKTVIQQWEKNYRSLCPIPSPSLLAAFSKAKKMKKSV